jgi:hypothetical protein
MHGGGADAKAFPHRAQGLSPQHHRFHNLPLALVQSSERSHGVVTFLGSLPFGEPVMAALIQPQRVGVLETPWRQQVHASLPLERLQLRQDRPWQCLLVSQRVTALAAQPLGPLLQPPRHAE